MGYHSDLKIEIEQEKWEHLEDERNSEIINRWGDVQNGSSEWADLYYDLYNENTYNLIPTFSTEKLEKDFCIKKRCEEYKERFDESVNVTQKLILSTADKPESLQVIYNMAYMQVFSAIEGYFYFVLNDLLSYDKELFIAFVKSDRELKDTKYKFEAIIGRENFVEEQIREFLQTMVFYDFIKVQVLFEKVLGRKIACFKKLYPYIAKRHDAIHRGGYKLDHSPNFVTKKDVENVIEQTLDLVIKLDSSLRQL